MKEIQTNNNCIKLLHIDTLYCGTKRFQSQLYVGGDSADFIMRKDGIMRNYDRGDKGFDFYEYKEPYQIVSDKKEMIKQVI